MKIEVVNNGCGVEGLKINGEAISTLQAHSSRYVYKHKDVVIKVSESYDEDGQSRQEWEVWNKLEPQDRKYFVPTLFYEKFPSGTEVSVQPFIEIVRAHVKPPGDVLKNIKRLKEKYLITDLDACPCNNWTLKYDQNGLPFPLIYDYGWHEDIGTRGCISL